MSKYLDSNGLLYFWQKLKALLANKVDVVSGKGLSTNDYTTTEKNKLAGIEAQANKYVLPTASETTLGGVKVGENLTIANGVLSAVQGSYTLPTASETTLGGVKVGSNLSITGSGVLNATDTTYADATTSAHGLMTAADKTKLNGIANNANNYSLPNASASTLGGVKVGTNLSIGSDGTLSATDTKYNPATSSANGLMSSTDKSKLDAFGAASTYALKSEITGMYKFKGSVATYADLPTTGNVVGDVWDVQSNNQNYAWTSTGTWDALGEVFQIISVSNSEIDTILAS